MPLLTVETGSLRGRQAMCFNEDPGSKLTGIEEFGEFQFLGIFFWITLPLIMTFHHLPVGTLASHRMHNESSFALYFHLEVSRLMSVAKKEDPVAS